VQQIWSKRWGALISFWQLRFLPQLFATDELVWHKQVPLKVSIVDDCWRTGYRLKLTCRGVAPYRLRPTLVYQDAEWLSRYLTCFYIAMSLVLYDTISGLGLAYLEQILKILVTTSINLFIIQVTQRHDDRFFN